MENLLNPEQPELSIEEKAAQYFGKLMSDFPFNVIADVGVDKSTLDIVAMNPETNVIMNQVKQTRLGHEYIAADQTLQFIERKPDGYFFDGIKNEDLLLILIHRLCYLDSMFPCIENKYTLDHLKRALNALLARSKARAEQNVAGKMVAHASDN